MCSARPPSAAHDLSTTASTSANSFACVPLASSARQQQRTHAAVWTMHAGSMCTPLARRANRRHDGDVMKAMSDDHTLSANSEDEEDDDVDVLFISLCLSLTART